MRARAVVERILDELKAGNADGVESFVVGSAGVAVGDGGNAEVLQRLHPLREDRGGCGILLEIDAANPAAAVVHIEVRGNLLMLGFKLDGSAGVAIEFGDVRLIRFGRSGNFAEVFLDVAEGAELTLLFAGPQADANGAARLDVQRGENAHHLHGHDGASAVVGRASGGSPGIEMAADHDEFVFEFGIGAGNFGDGIEAVLVVACEFAVDVEFQAHRDAGLEQAIDAAVTFDSGDGDGQRIGVLAAVSHPGKSGAGIVEDDAAGAGAVSATVAGNYNCYGLFGGQKLTDLLPEGQALQKSLESIVGIRRSERIVLKFFEVGFFVAGEERFVHRLDFARFSPEDDFAAELAFIFLEIFFDLDVYPDGGGGDGPFRGRRPRPGLSDEDGVVRRSHAQPGVVLLPTHAKFAPVFEMSIGAAHGGKLIAGPFVGALEV